MALRRGIFGGSFDPPHLGHLLLSERVREALSLDVLHWMPVAQSPFKQGHATTDAAHRMAMIEAAIDGNPRFELSDADLRSKAPHYSVDLLRELRGRWPHDALIFVMGGDAFNGFDRWHRPREILALATLAVVGRPGDPLEVERLTAQWPELRDRLAVVEMPLIDLSSTDIRQRVGAGLSIRYMVPAAVRRYIRQKGLYRTD
ncbi:MAG: nicotinate (nicotinamide) nucleotide adenylyltransferase [Anaerolineales bacterium]|nr:nicotinate (nicotinamide) nucleotide adenylyltransferase [Anaerolineales bacterium]MCB9128800.1 nicotinate (nicotinamide) nucleotide adenylyltransferase [Ardenticatenales bacterium]MCB9171364.1 nicotinate (nicotinamide) nucleotide adenylyltransferase [Ardenticatenales bacterium]